MKLHVRHFIDHTVACSDQLGLSTDTQFRAHIREHEAKCQPPVTRRSWGATMGYKTLPLPVPKQKSLGDPPLGTAPAPSSQIASFVEQMQGTPVGDDDTGSNDDEWD